jgi:hypothetical protein
MVWLFNANPNPEDGVRVSKVETQRWILLTLTLKCVAKETLGWTLLTLTLKWGEKETWLRKARVRVRVSGLRQKKVLGLGWG